MGLVLGAVDGVEAASPPCWAVSPAAWVAVSPVAWVAVSPAAWVAVVVASVCVAG